jgi:hypothetical protein
MHLNQDLSTSSQISGDSYHVCGGLAVYTDGLWNSSRLLAELVVAPHGATLP